MKKELSVYDLIPGKIYHIHDNDFEAIFTFKSIVDCDRVHTFDSISNFHDKNKWLINNEDYWITDRKCREATTKEIYWLKQCVKTLKFIPQNELDYIEEVINNTYSIY